MRRSMLLPFWSRGQAEARLGGLEKLSKFVCREHCREGVCLMHYLEFTSTCKVLI